MPKFPTFPTLYNDVLKLDISKLKEWGYLKPDQTKTGIITWSRNGQTTGKIEIRTDTRSEYPYIELNYEFRGEPRKYKVYFTSTPSNLNKGKIWYFLCPHTQKRCRKLYSVQGYFFHREAFKGCMYEKQTRSKKYRHLDKYLDAFFKTSELKSELYQKHLKKTYAGKPTKKYLRLKQKLQLAEIMTYKEVELLLMS